MTMSGMSWLRAGCLIGFGVMAASVAGIGSASAQYSGDGYGRSYERRDRDFDRRRDDGRRYDRDDRRRGDDLDRGGRGQRDSFDQRGPRSGYDNRGSRPGYNNPMQGMTLQEQKQAVKNHRDAQKKAIKRGYVIP